MTITRYRKKPIEVDTIRWTGDNAMEVAAFTGSENFMTFDAEQCAEDPEATAAVYDEQHWTWVLVYTGQHIVRGVRGELYPLAVDALTEAYEAADHTQSPPSCAHCQPVTPDDITVIAGLARGHALGRICEDLSKSPRATRRRLRQLADRLGLTGHPRPQLVDYAYRNGHLDGLAPEPRPPIDELPGRLAQTLDALARGLTIDETAREMGISPDTARAHRRRLYTLLEARTRTHAVALGWQLGLLGRAPSPHARRAPR
ncbi:LuxR C-terminal-related transcriptional regulator [Streptomyces sp. NPDC050658]|uniref:helix-turn-helix transcriptional regulator n=1 Tax=unclassified Streptomyces TaxID=2593676 RepID=UPI003431A226